MSLVKISQEFDNDLEGEDILLSNDLNDLKVSEDHVVIPIDDLIIDEDNQYSGDEELKISEKEKEPELILTLDKIPGAEDQDDIDEPEIEIEEPKEVIVNDDPWNWGEPKNYVTWLSNIMQKCPNHTGRDSAGLERAIYHFQRIRDTTGQAIRKDLNNEIDISAVEKVRTEIHNALKRLEDRLDQVNRSKFPSKNKKKKASEEEHEGMVKEAQKATHVGGIVITVPLFISYLTRVMINSMVSNGKDIEDIFDKLSDKYKLTEREQVECVTLLSDMGYPVRRDRGFLLDEEIKTDSENGFDWAQNFSA